MRHFVALILLFSLACAFDDEWKIEPAIVGGTTPVAHAFPFMAAIHWVTTIPSFSSRLVCGGALLSRRWVLTGAHCITALPNSVRLDVILGMHNERLHEEGRVRFTIGRDSVKVHPDWVAGKQGPNDLALFFLPQPVTISNTIQPINLPKKGSAVTGTGTALGWGSLRATGMGNSYILQQVDLPFITNAVCQSQLFVLGLNPLLLGDTNICTGPVAARGICGGDTGGPIVQQSGTAFILRGIASWIIDPCAQANAPSGIYKRVSAYIDWIEKVTGI